MTRVVNTTGATGGAESSCLFLFFLYFCLLFYFAFLFVCLIYLFCWIFLFFYVCLFFWVFFGGGQGWERGGGGSCCSIFVNHCWSFFLLVIVWYCLSSSIYGFILSISNFSDYLIWQGAHLKPTVFGSFCYHVLNVLPHVCSSKINTCVKFVRTE